MKKKIYFTLLITIFIVINNNCNGQNWLLGGNPNLGPNGTGSVSNFYGTVPGNTSNLRLGIGGTSAIFVGGTGYASPGFIGIGSGKSGGEEMEIGGEVYEFVEGGCGE